MAAAGERVAATQKAARRRWFAPRRVTRDHLLALTRELATLLRAGLPLDRALEILINLADAPPVARLLQTVRDSVRGGKSLSQALDMHREVFSRFYVNIVRAGEAGGALGAVLTRLSETMERNKDLRGRDLGDDPARIRRAAVPADLRASRQGAACSHSGGHFRRHGSAEILVAADHRRRCGSVALPPLAQPP